MLTRETICSPAIYTLTFRPHGKQRKAHREKERTRSKERKKGVFVEVSALYTVSAVLRTNVIYYYSILV